MVTVSMEEHPMNRVGNDQGLHSLTQGEGPNADFLHTGGDRNGFQIAAAGKGPGADAGDGVGNGDLNGIRTEEGVFADVCDAIIDDDFFDFGSVVVPGNIIRVGPVVHGTGAGDGQDTLPGEIPNQVVAAVAGVSNIGAGAGLGCLAAGGDPSNVAAVILADRTGPGGVVRGIIGGCGDSLECVGREGRCIAIKSDFLQTGAAVEGGCLHCGHAGRNINLFQCGAVSKHTTAEVR